MLRRLIPIILALIVLGIVTGLAVIMIVLLGQDWGDALFWLFASVMIGSALLVVTMKDIIRCGLAMIVCFAALVRDAIVCAAFVRARICNGNRMPLIVAAALT